MKLNEEGYKHLKKVEGFRNHPYYDTAGVPTIGYGFTYYNNGKKVEITDPPISRADADSILYEIVEDFEDCVKDNVSTTLNQNQYNALVSFSYNVGCDAFTDSTLLERVNVDPCHPDIENQFKRWIYSGGKKTKGLKKRRNMEYYLYSL